MRSAAPLSFRGRFVIFGVGKVVGLLLSRHFALATYHEIHGQEGV